MWTIGFRLLFYLVYKSVVVKDILHAIKQTIIKNTASFSDMNRYFLLSTYTGMRELHGSCEMRAMRAIVNVAKILHTCDLEKFRQPFMGIICAVHNDNYATSIIKMDHFDVIDYRPLNWNDRILTMKAKKRSSNRHRILFYVHGGVSIINSYISAI